MIRQRNSVFPFPYLMILILLISSFMSIEPVSAFLKITCGKYFLITKISKFMINNNYFNRSVNTRDKQWQKSFFDIPDIGLFLKPSPFVATRILKFGAMRTQKCRLRDPTCGICAQVVIFTSREIKTFEIFSL